MKDNVQLLRMLSKSVNRYREYPVKACMVYSFVNLSHLPPSTIDIEFQDVNAVFVAWQNLPFYWLFCSVNSIVADTLASLAYKVYKKGGTEF